MAGFGDADAWEPSDPAYEYAHARMLRRGDPAKVEHELVQRGVAEERARDAVASARASINGRRRVLGLGTMVLGGAACAVGLVVTFASYDFAKAGESQGFTVWYGAIAFGALAFVRGLAQFLRPAIRPPTGKAPYRRRASPSPPSPESSSSPAAGAPGETRHRLG